MFFLYIFSFVISLQNTQKALRPLWGNVCAAQWQRLMFGCVYRTCNNPDSKKQKAKKWMLMHVWDRSTADLQPALGEQRARWGNSRSPIAQRRAPSPRERMRRGWEREWETQRKGEWQGERRWRGGGVSIPWHINCERALTRHNCWPCSALLGVVTNEIN